MGSSDTAGTLLADIAGLIADGLRTLSLSDKREWGEDEREAVRALEGVLDEARRDFQALGPLVNGRSQYEHDRRYESLRELRSLRDKFGSHVRNLREWNRSGGPIDPTWTRDTQRLGRELHRTQCRVAMRVFASSHEASERCLGAFIVHRVLRKHQRGRVDPDNEEIQEEENKEDKNEEQEDTPGNQEENQEEVRACRAVGSFQRFGEGDIAFVCDFCDGHLVWTDLEYMPATSSPGANWAATAMAHSGEQQKEIVAGPVAVANHVAPRYGDWEARLLCPVCEEVGGQEDEEWRPDGFLDDVAALQEHLEWQHGPLTASLPSLPSLPSNVCAVM